MTTQPWHKKSNPLELQDSCDFRARKGLLEFQRNMLVELQGSTGFAKADEVVPFSTYDPLKMCLNMNEQSPGRRNEILVFSILTP